MNNAIKNMKKKHFIEKYNTPKISLLFRMMFFCMCLQQTIVAERNTTFSARERFFLRVNSQVYLQVVVAIKGFRTERTFVRTFSGMRQHVLPQAVTLEIRN